ncbi:EF-hand domain-containing protein [Brevundimonas abyssalis]|uniref:EF-hand domain-containing protein n=1 Tax=Brevundimonas abyssalis TAR-001 TaxID=1391729 RepID=A0A8E0ND58_9CAUL|nr:EF-hand domain-containing protein [Brevundimonas abyssalis]GAD60124.1 hypothetical protein MBEBAB_2374 [Brevundimonas abyssalis TAR-001]
MRTAAAIAALMLIAPAAGAQEAENRTETRVMVLNGAGSEGGLDRDGDGYVTREEFLMPMMTAWTRIDAEGAGRVSTEALAQGVRGARAATVTSSCSALAKTARWSGMARAGR